MPTPRLLLCPQFTEVEWAIAPRLAEWAEVATFDAPGFGDEPPPEVGPKVDYRESIVRRALREIESRGWEEYFVVGDAWGTATAVRVATAEPDRVLGVALGHASVDYASEGERPSVNGEVVAAMTQLMRTDYDSFIRYGITQFTQGGFDEEMASEMVRRFPASEIAFRVWEMHVERPEPVGDLLRQVDKPLLLGKHEGCLVFTAEGYEDLIASFPEADTVAVSKASAASEDFAGALREFCERVGG